MRECPLLTYLPCYSLRRAASNEAEQHGTLIEPGSPGFPVEDGIRPVIYHGSMRDKPSVLSIPAPHAANGGVGGGGSSWIGWESTRCPT